MSKGIVVHVSEVNISPNSGMGRVEYYWQQAFERAGYTFLHIGPHEVGALKHPALFPAKAYQYYKGLNIAPVAFIVHEPAGGFFVNKGIPCFIESHGVERRYWSAQLSGSVPPAGSATISLKTKLLFPLWRLRGTDQGLKKADKLLLINSDDANYVKAKYKRSDKDILIFKNGINKLEDVNAKAKESVFTVLFNGSWLERKGIHVLVRAATQLFDQGFNIDYLLIGTGKKADAVLSDWPEKLRPFVKVVNKFAAVDERSFLASASLFVLPSYFEGQPLSLLEAMAAGKCCITTNCCGQKDIIKTGESGILFAVGSEVDLASAISNCYKDRELIKKIGNNAKLAVEGRSWEKVSDEVVYFIDHTLSEKRKKCFL